MPSGGCRSFTAIGGRMEKHSDCGGLVLKTDLVLTFAPNLLYLSIAHFTKLSY